MKNYRRGFCMLCAPAFAAVILSGAVATARAADLFVSVSTGNDANAGTIAAPFKTIYKAKQAVQTLPRTGPINVWIRSGTYYLDSALVFAPADGGTASAPITYSAYCGDTVVLSGGIRVTTTWTTSSGNIMVTSIGTGVKCDQLFLNGARMVLARYPNFNANQPVLDGFTSWSTITSRASKWKTPTQGPGYIRAINSAGWGGEDYYITSVSGTTINTTWVGDNNRGSGMNTNEVLVENIFEELDTVNEWYYNKTTGNLYFWPPAGTNLSTATIELASQDCLLRFVGTSPSTANSVTYITFNGIAFTQTYRTLFDGTYEDILMSDWAIVRNGTVFMQNAEHITVQNCLFNQVGGNGVFMSGYNRSNVVYNNGFINGGASPVCLFGLTSAVRCPNSWSGMPTCTDSTPGPLTNEYPAYISVDNNMMFHFGRFERQSAGVSLSVTECDTIRHNTIDSCPRAGLNVCDGNFGGHIFEFNDVSHCVMETGDHGPWNGWGRDRFWVLGGQCTNGCNGVEKRPWALLDAMYTSHIRNNRLRDENGNGGFGIDLDDGCTNYWIYNNLTINCGIKLREGFVRKVYNNIIVNGQQHCHCWFASCGDTILRNIIYSDTGSPMDFATGANWNPTAGSTGAVTVNEALSDYNCFARSYNPPAGWETHSKMNTNPLFNNPATMDYSVQSGSPALTLGFVNFPMDSFGQMSAPGGAQCPSTEIRPVPAGEAVKNFLCRANGSTVTVQYWLGEDGPVTMDLCALDGKNISTIAKSFEKAGAHTFVWNSKGIKSGARSPNSYLLVLTTNGGKEVRRITLLW